MSSEKKFDLNAVKEVVSNLKKQLLGEEEIKLEAQTTLDDGTIIGTTADAFAAGVDVYTIIDGETQPLPAGSYATEDGYALIVAEDGIVDSYEQAAAEEEEEMSEEPGKELIVQTIGVLENLLNEFSSVSEQMTAFSERLDSIENPKNDESTELSEEKETLELSEDPIQTNGEAEIKTFSKEEMKGMTREQRAQYIIQKSK